jgi:dTDP-4-amino-4,6-dideoxygalactose transaminase
MSDRILFGKPSLGTAERELVAATLDSGWIGQGPLVARFEKAFAAELGAPHAVAVSSCTAALHLSLVALGIGAGDEVITTPFTFVATLNAIEHVGARPVVVDIDRESLNLTPAAVERAITPRTRAMLPVHFGGRPLDVPGFQRLADEHGLWLVEDAAHAVGAIAAGHRVGGSGHPRTLTCFSFYPNKNLASAEGGAVTTADAAIAERLRELRLHGLRSDAWDRYRSDRYRPALAGSAGYKANWTDLQAAIALPQLAKLEGFLATREYLAERYDELLRDVDGVRVRPRGPRDLDWRHALHLYQVEIAGPPGTRDRVLSRLLERGVGAAVHYIGLNRHPHYRRTLPARIPVSDWASDHLLTLPLHPAMSDADLIRVRDELARAVHAELGCSDAAFRIAV